MNTIGIDRNLDRARIRKLLMIGLFASALTGIGDFLLGYADSPAGSSIATSVMASAPNLQDWQMIIRFKAFSKGLTPYPKKARWFCVLIGAVPALVLSVILGPETAIGAGIGTMFLCFGNAFMFGGLLATLPSAEQFTAFENSLRQPSEG